MMDSLKLLLISVLMPTVVLAVFGLLLASEALFGAMFELAPYVMPVYWIYDVLGRMMMRKASSNTAQWFFWAGYVLSVAFVVWQVLTAASSDVPAQIGAAVTVFVMPPIILLVCLFTMWTIMLERSVEREISTDELRDK